MVSVKTMAEVMPTISSDFEFTHVKDYFDNWLTLSGETVNMHS